MNILNREYEKIWTIKNSYLVSKGLKEKEIKEFEIWLEWYKNYQKLKGRRRTALKHIRYKKLNYYATLTFKDEKLLSTDINRMFKSLKELFSRYRISYYLVPEFAPNTGRLHYHGFISVKDKTLLQPKIINKKAVHDRYNNEVLELIPYEKNYGYSTIKDISKKQYYERQKMINYTLEYSLKNGMRARFDRIKKRSSYEWAVFFFGDELVKKVN